jgi:transcriptional regulator with XRE-family HTH domain
MSIIPETCRAARGLLGWTQETLCKAANVSFTSVRGFEAGRSVPVPNNLAAIVAAFTAAGVEFTNGDAPGVRLRRPRGAGDDGGGNGDGGGDRASARDRGPRGRRGAEAGGAVPA